jgi:hypothetical protein
MLHGDKSPEKSGFEQPRVLWSAAMVAKRTLFQSATE